MKYTLLFILSLFYSTIAISQTSNTLNIEMSYHLIDIREMDDDDQTMYIDFLLEFKWIDRDAHENKEDDITAEEYDEDDPQLWIPGIQVINDYGLERSEGRIFYLEGDKVSYVRRYNGKVVQKMDFRNFPFDSQQFEVDILLSETRPINLLLEEEDFGAFGSLSIPGWKISKGTVIPLDLNLAIGERPTFRITFNGERKSGYYLLKVILPILLIVMMSWTVFWVDPTKNDAQLTVSATSMLSLVAFLFTISNQIPKIGYLTNLDIFSYGSMVFVFLALSEAVLTSYISFHKHSLTARKIDRYSRIIFPGTYALFMFMLFIT